MIRTEPCLTGRLGTAYPAAKHDVELLVAGISVPELAETLREHSGRILQGDPDCRKVVYAAPAGDQSCVAAAEEAGFRFVVDVDLSLGQGCTESLSLLVREPDVLTRIDMDLDHVPEQ